VTLTTPSFREFFSGVMSGLWFQTYLQISSKSVKNCDRESARMHTRKCVGHRTPDTRHRTRQMILYSAQCCYAYHWTDNNSKN